MDLAAHPHSHRRNVVMGPFAVALTHQHRLPAAAPSTTTTAMAAVAASTPIAPTAAPFYPTSTTTTSGASSSATTTTTSSSSSDLWSSSWLMFDAAVESRSNHHHDHQYNSAVGLNSLADSASHDMDLIKSVPNVSRRELCSKVGGLNVCVVMYDCVDLFCVAF